MFILRDNFSSAGKSTQMMAGIAVVMFNVNGMCFPDDMPLWRQNLREGIPVIGVKSAVLQVLYFVIEPSEGFRITTAEHPGHSSPCATVNSLDDPKLSFFDRTKCHISSNSI